MRSAGGLLKESPAPPGTFPEYDCDCPESARMRGSGLFFCLFLRCDMVGGGWFPVTKGGRAPGVAGAAGVSGTLRGHGDFARLPPLPLAYFPAPIPPSRARRALFPSGEGGDYYFISPGAEPERHLLALPRGRGPSQTPKFLSPGPPSPWLPALFTSAASQPVAGVPGAKPLA